MSCTACHRLNLPGGVRCVYCGVPFPAAPDYDLGSSAVSAPTAVGSSNPTAAPSMAPGAGPRENSSRGRASAGALAGLAALALKGKALLSLLKFGKLALMLASLFAFVWTYQRWYGWRFSVGFAVCLLIHEMGHVIVNWRKGLKQTAPMFIPFIGALIVLKGFPSPEIEAESGAGGPIAGLIASVGCAAIAFATGEAFWWGLAATSFNLNLLNLIPIWQLDGAHISCVFTPKTWNGVLIVLLLWCLKADAGLLWVVLLAAFLTRLGQSPDTRYRTVTTPARIKMVAVYLGLCIALGAGGVQCMKAARSAHGSQTHEARSARPAVMGLRPAPAGVAAAHRAHPAPRTEQPRLLLPDLTTVQGQRAALPVFVVVLVVIFLIGTGGWLLTAYLLAAAAGEEMGRDGLKLSAGMSMGLMPILFLFWIKATDHLPGLGGLLGPAVSACFGPVVVSKLIVAYLVGMASAGSFALYQVVKAGDRRSRHRREWLTYRGLAAAAGAALVFAYWQSSIPIALVVLLGLVLFYLPRLWLLPSLAATLWEQAGATEKAVALRERSLSFRPPDREAADIWRHIASSYVKLDRGESALAALDNAASFGPMEDAASFEFTHCQDLRARALILQRRFPEALQVCETLLQAPPGDRVGPWRLVIAHTLLGLLALNRHWTDEALAQSECAVKATVPRGDRDLKYRFATMAYLVRARALAVLGQGSESLAAAAKAQQYGATEPVGAQLALARSEGCLASGDIPSADREAAEAARLEPGSLHFRFVLAQVQAAAGHVDESRRLLKELAAAFPREHWGMEAQELLASLSAVR